MTMDLAICEKIVAESFIAIPVLLINASVDRRPIHTLGEWR